MIFLRVSFGVNVCFVSMVTIASMPNVRIPALGLTSKENFVTSEALTPSLRMEFMINFTNFANIEESPISLLMSNLKTDGFFRRFGNISDYEPRADDVDQYRGKFRQVDQSSTEACLWK
jgi:hypothetical protein